MKHHAVAAALLVLTGCWAEVFLPADTDGSTGDGPAPTGSAMDSSPTVCDADPDDMLCDGDCVDPRFDRFHCGGCDVECGVDERCEDSECVFACDCDPGFEVCDDDRCVCREGTHRCGDVCVVLRTDATNCGECGNLCDDVCLDFNCEDDCGSLTDCDGDCTDPEFDPFNCGECGEECDAEEVCVFGQCRGAELIPFGCEECPCEGFCEELDAGMICCESVLIDGPLCVDTPICGE